MNFKIFKSIFILQDDETEDEVDPRKSDGTPFTKSSMDCFIHAMFFELVSG